MTVFSTNLKESFKSKLIRMRFNWFPAYRRGGGRICFIAGNFQEIHVKVSLNWSTRNYVGTVFGGSLYAVADPIYMIQLIQILGTNYVVWDKAASIQFLRPVKNTVFARFIIDDNLINEIKQQVAEHGKYVIDLPAQLEDQEGNVYVNITKQLYIASKDYYKARPSSNNSI